MLDVSASSGAGGRFMVSYEWDLYGWIVEEPTDAPSAEYQYVAEASASGGSGQLTIPGAGRASEKKVTWLFNVTATNWLGGIGWASIQVGTNITVSYPFSSRNTHCICDKLAHHTRFQLGGASGQPSDRKPITPWFALLTPHA